MFKATATLLLLGTQYSEAIIKTSSNAASATALHGADNKNPTYSYLPIRPSAPVEEKSNERHLREEFEPTLADINLQRKERFTKCPDPAKPGRSEKIIYHHNLPRNEVMLGVPKLYTVWYGDWSSESAQAGRNIVNRFLNSSSGSPWFQILKTYPMNEAEWPTGQFEYEKDIFVDSSTYGTELQFYPDFFEVLGDQIFNAKFPRDENAMYLLLTSGEVNMCDGDACFCDTFCGFHSFAGHTNLKFMWIGDAGERCPNNCAWDTDVSPNGHIGADGMISVIAHEIAEAISDPRLQAWYDANYEENADKCAWTFGSNYTTANGAIANMQIDGYDYLIQRNWKTVGGQCCAKSLTDY